MSRITWPPHRAGLTQDDAEEVERSLQYSQEVVQLTEAEAKQAHRQMLEEAAFWPECAIAVIALLGVLAMIWEQVP